MDEVVDSVQDDGPLRVDDVATVARERAAVGNAATGGQPAQTIGQPRRQFRDVIKREHPAIVCRDDEVARA